MAQSEARSRISDPKKILFYIWIGFSTFSAVVSLASLLDGVLAWVGFIRSMIEAYRDLVDGFWGAIFSVFQISLSQELNDYLTLNSLFAISITWGFYRTGDELGFALASLRQFLKNNLFDFTLGGNTFDLFNKGALKQLNEKCGGVSSNATAAIETLTRTYPKILLTIDGIVSSALLIVLVFTCSFLVPAYLKWRDLRWNNKSRDLMISREFEIQDYELSSCESSIIMEKFNSVCVFSAKSDRQILQLYHSIFRKSIGWYLLAIFILFMVIIFINYVIIAI